MLAIVWLQLATLAVLAVATGIIWGIHAAISLCLGGLAYVLPTLCAILILKFLKPYPVLAGTGFVVSESLKIILALILMTATILLYREIQFLPFFVGLLSVSHLVFLFYLKVHRYGK